MLKIIGKILKFVLPILILIGGAQATIMLVKSKKPPRSRIGPQEKVKLVRTTSLKPMNHRVVVKAQAVTKPAAELSIASQVKGKVIWVSTSLVEGGYVKKGALLFKIDPTDYYLQIQQAQSGLARASYELDLIAAKQKAAESGIKIYQKMSKNKELPEMNIDISSLARYEPQIANAKAGLISAIANLKQAKLNVKRTKIYVPFSGYIRSVSLALGQIVSSSQPVLKMFKDKPIILNVSLPASELEWIQVEENPYGRKRQGSIVLISKMIGEKKHKWQGIVKRQLQEIDSLGRLVTVIVEAPQPVSNHGFALPLGMLVDVEILGKTIKNVFGIPPDVLRKDATVWVLSENSRLEIRNVTVIRKNEKTVFVSKGLDRKDVIVTSQIPSAVAGMKLRKVGKQGTRPDLRKSLGKRPELGKPRNKRPELGKPQRNGQARRKRPEKNS